MLQRSLYRFPVQTMKFCGVVDNFHDLMITTLQLFFQMLLDINRQRFHFLYRRTDLNHPQLQRLVEKKHGIGNVENSCVAVIHSRIIQHQWITRPC